MSDDPPRPGREPFATVEGSHPRGFPVAELVTAEGGGAQASSLWLSLALGVDLGGNATAVGASANVIVLGLAEKAGHKIGFWGFTKYGLIVASVTLAVTTPYVLLRYFVLA